jgi:hypothetical protein
MSKEKNILETRDRVCISVGVISASFDQSRMKCGISTGISNENSTNPQYLPS